MVAIVSGIGLGLDLTSMGELGGKGALGTGGQGPSGEQAYVNAATGNLVLQRQDALLAGTGLDAAAVRTYNSLGEMNDDDGDNWSLGIYNRQLALNGTRNAPGSNLVRTGRDGSQATYVWDGTRYFTTAGGGAHDTIVYNQASHRYERVDGSTGLTEWYDDDTLQLLRYVDPSYTGADLAAHSLTFEYNGTKLARTINGSGAITHYTYNAGGHLISIGTQASASAAIDTLVTYGYYGNGLLKLVSVDLTPRDGNAADKVHTTTYTYDSSKRVTNIARNDGTSLAITYTSSGRVQSVKDALNQTTTFTYDTATRRTTVTDPLNKTWLYDYDADGHLLRVTSPAVGGSSSAVSYAYDASGNLTQATDADGKVTTYQYDTRGNCVRETDPLGRTVLRTYSAANQLLIETRSTLLAFGATTAAQRTATAAKDGSNMTLTGTTASKATGANGTWDSSIRSTVGYVGGASVSFSPAQGNKGLMIGLTADPSADPAYAAIDYALFCHSSGKLYTYENGVRKDLTGAPTYTAGDRLQVTYDGTKIRYLQNGRLLREITIAIAGPLYVDSSFGDVGATVNELRFGDQAVPDLITRYVYAAGDARQLRFVITPAGRVTEYRYNAYGQRTAQLDYTDDAFNASSYSLAQVPTEADMTSWVASRTDLSGTVRKDWVYDAFGRVWQEKDYDKADTSGANLTLRETRLHTYDPAGRLISVTRAVGAATDEGGTPKTSYAYDGLGRLLSTTDEYGNTTTTVYTDSTQTAVTTYVGGASQTTVSDKAGRVISVTKSGLGATRYAYDAAGHLLMTTDPTGARSYALYDDAGRLAADIDGMGRLTEYSYDKAGRLYRRYTYAKAIASSKLRSGDTPLNPTLASIRPATVPTDLYSWQVWDEAGRLAFDVQEDGAFTGYDYDGAGRLVCTTRYATRVAVPPTLTALRDRLDDADMLAAAPSNRVSRNFYDADGKLTGTIDAAGYLTRNSYDQAGRLVATQRYANAVVAQRLVGSLGALIPTASGKDQAEYFYYDNRNLLVGHVDAEKYLTVNVYTDRGLLRTQTRYATALTVAVGWQSDVTALLSSIRAGGTLTAADQQTTRYYTRDNKLMREVDHEGTIRTYEYDTRGNLVKTVLASGYVAARTQLAQYDAWNRKIAELGGNGASRITGTMTQSQINAVWDDYAVNYAYDAAGRLISQTNARDATTRYYYDLAGRTTHTIDAMGGVVRQQYTTLGQLASTTRYYNALTTAELATLVGGLYTDSTAEQLDLAIGAPSTDDSVQTYTYDTLGRLDQQSNARGHATQHQYNVFGELATRTVTLQTGSTRSDRYEYDLRGLQTLQVLDTGSGSLIVDTATSYDAFGRVISITDDDKVETRAYDRLGRLTVATDALGGTRRTAYDAYGRTLSVADEMGKVTSYTYDASERSITVTTPDGVAITTVHTRHGQTASITDGNGTVTTYEYDLNGNLVATRRAGKLIESRSYDKADRVFEVVDAAGTITDYDYDAANRVFKRIVDPGDGNLHLRTLWEYDALGRTVTQTDPADRVTTYTYDTDGNRITQIVDPYGLKLKTKWEYDAAGHVLKVTDPRNAVTTYTYDAVGRVTKEVADAATGGLQLTRQYEYDDHGNMLSSWDRRGNVTRYVYDSNNRLTFTAKPNGTVTRNDYDAAGRLVRVVEYVDRVTSSESPADVDFREGYRDRYYLYDNDGRLEYTIDPVGAVTRSIYDDNGNVVRRIAYWNKVTAGEIPPDLADTDRDHVTCYGYDNANREIWRMGPAKDIVRNTYDDAGRLVMRRYLATLKEDSTLAVEDVPETPNDRAERYVYDAAGRETWRSDATGAVTGTLYAADGQPSSVRRYKALAIGTAPSLVDTSAGYRETSYTYDAAGRLQYTVDTAGYVTRNSYDLAGNLTNVLRYSQKPADRAQPGTITLDAALDRQDIYTYDMAGRLTDVRDAEHHTEHYELDGEGNRTAFTNKNGYTWTYTYDHAGRLVTETSPRVILGTTERDEGSISYTETSASGVPVVTKMVYDSYGQLTSRTEANGRPEERTTTYDYDAAGRQTKVIYPPVQAYTETLDQLNENKAPGDTARSEAATTPYTQTWYDVFGSAVASRARNGAINFKSYDPAGRVSYEIDALGYVTGYERDAFGQATETTRYAQATTLQSTAPGLASRDLTPHQVESALSPLTGPPDRSIKTTYDKAGRVTQIVEPKVYNYDSRITAGNSDENDTAGKTTQNTYNAYGELVRVAELQNSHRDTWAKTYHYYDARGNRITTVDAMGYVTKNWYDYAGDNWKQAEYANAATGNWDEDSAPETPTGDYRVTEHTWDKTHHKLTDTLVDAKYSVVADVSDPVEGDLTTIYGYDAVGNLVSTEDATGATTYSYYDALGRVRAIAAPARSSDIDGETKVPITEFKRDAYGNVLVKIERASSGTGVSADAYWVGNASEDRRSYTIYDASGNALQTEDAKGYLRYNSYTVDGKLAKTWQSVYDNDGYRKVIYTVYSYDALGRLESSYAPQPDQHDCVSTNYRYNGFGELVGKGRAGGGMEESYEYDNAGRLWKTNSDGGYYKVYLYDLRGRRTAEIASAGSGRGTNSVDVSTATSAEEAAGWISPRRIDIKYDLLGREIERLSPERMLQEGGITTRKATANAVKVSSTTYQDNGDDPGQWNGENRVDLTWSALAYLGSGEVKVALTYYRKNTDITQTQTQIFAGHLASTGVTLRWDDAGATGMYSGGISSVKRLVVWKKNINGEWVEVIDRDSSASRPFGTYGTQVEIGSPINTGTLVTFRYKARTSSNWISLRQADGELKEFGDSHWFDASTLVSGTYDYEVWFDAAGVDGKRMTTGSFIAKTNDTDDDLDDQPRNWLRPIEQFTWDRWGNMLSRSDPRDVDWITRYAYDDRNLRVEESRPNAYNGTQTNNPVRTWFYNRAGRQIALRDERGYLSTQSWNSAGQLIGETHADDGRVTYNYDIFGQKIRTIDAVGNGDGATPQGKARHTTLYTYDRLGRLVKTQHGDYANGSVRVVTLSGGLTQMTGYEWRNLQESFEYDEAGRKISQTNGAGETTKYWYDWAGNVCKTLLPGNQQSTDTYTINSGGGYTKVSVDANNNDASWSWSYYNELRAHTDLGGKTYEYTYDEAGQLTTQINGRGQNIKYFYDAAGQQTGIHDYQIGQVETFAYDLAGNRLREKTMLDSGEVFQDNHLAYDVLGRLVDSADNRVHLTFKYDAAGNRIKITTYTQVDAVGDDDRETVMEQTRYFLYDEMNRQTVVDAVDEDGTITAEQGHKLTYDLNGNRIKDVYYGRRVTSDKAIVDYNGYGRALIEPGAAEFTTTENERVTESYDYDALNRLTSTVRDGVQVDLRLYDAASRVVQSGSEAVTNGYVEARHDGLSDGQQEDLSVHRNRYDDNGRVMFQRVYRAGQNTTAEARTIDYDDSDVASANGWNLGYDAAGNVVGYELKSYDDDGDISTTQVTKVELSRYEGYVELRTSADDNGSAADGVHEVLNKYDENGHLYRVEQEADTLDKNVVTNTAGQVLRVSQSGNNLWTHIVNGEIMGQHGVGPDEFDPRTPTGSAHFAQTAKFEFGYKQITAGNPAAGVGQYTVRTGESLKAIAQAAYGDSSQWWRIAQANGLSGDADLKAGQSLQLPSPISATGNNTETFQPYNQSDVVRDTSPYLPAPGAAGGGCGGFAMIIIIVVAVVATIFTAGAAAMALAGTLSSASLGTVMAAGATALSGGIVGGAVGLTAVGGSIGASTFAAAAVGGAIGSIASQGVGIAIGVQDKLNWKQVAGSAIASAVGSGVGAAIGGTGMGAAVVRSVATNVLTQGISVAVGVQDRFSWVSVAASAAGSAAGGAVSDGVGDAMHSAIGNEAGSRIATGTLVGIVSGATVSLMRGGRVSASQVATDAFGNALGQGIVDEMQAPGTAPEAGATGTADSTRFSSQQVDYSMLDTDNVQAAAAMFASAGAGDPSRDDLLAADKGYALGRESAGTELTVADMERQYKRENVSPAVPKFGRGVDPDSLSDHTLRVLNQVSISADIDIGQLLVTSTIRTPDDQARIMFSQLENGGLSTYGPAGQQLIDIYKEGIKNGDAPNTIRQSMSDRAQSLLDQGVRVSNHLGDPTQLNVFDVAPSSIPPDRRQAFQRALSQATNSGLVEKFFSPYTAVFDKAFHIEIRQPTATNQQQPEIKLNGSNDK